MTHLRSSMTFAIIASMLSACGGPTQQSLVPANGRPASWLPEGLAHTDLLYVPNVNGIVNVYRYAQRRLVGVLLDFVQPRGACSDAAGNVYITDVTKGIIVEYAHGGKNPIGKFNDKPYNPNACAVSPASGDLAVANDGYDYGSAGNLAIFKRGRHSPIILNGSSYDDQFTSCAYDQHGDLLTTSTYGYLNWYTHFYYLPRKSSHLIPMSLPRGTTSSWPPVRGLGWDGQYWVVATGDLFRYTIDVTAKFIDKITLSGGYSAVGQFAIYRKTAKSQATQVVGPTSIYPYTKASIEYWDYPAGGNPIGEITKDLDNPQGVAISLGTP